MYFNQIDSLRALAVIAVILNHLNESFLPSGFLGVDVFFVISGFVVTHSLLAKQHSSALDFLKHFYVKRFKRLFPALFTCFLISSVIGSIFIFDIVSSLKTGFAAIFAHSNIYLAQKDFSYFGSDAAYNLFTHTWSLSVEEQFYLFFPLLFICFGYLSSPTHIKRYKLATTSLILLSAAFFFYNFESNFDVAFYYMPSRLWQLMLGSLVYFYQRQVKNKVSLDLITVLILAVFLVPKQYQVYSSIIVSLLTCLSLIHIKNSSVLLQQPSAQTVGKYSYSLYLWHWPTIVLCKYIFGPTLISYIFILTLTSVSSIFSYRFIETKLRFKEWGKFKFRYLLIIPLLMFSRSKFKTISEALYIGNESVPFSLTAKEFPFDKCSHQRFIKSNDTYDKFETKVLKHCVLDGTPDNKNRKIFSYGSSYLQQLLPALKSYDLSRNDTDVHSFYVPSCLIWEDPHIEKGFGKVTSCSKFYTFFQRLTLENAKPGDIVIISVAFNKLDDYQFIHDGQLISLNETIKEMKKDIEIYKNKLLEKGVSLYLTQAIPYLTIDPVHCTQPWSHLNPRCYSNELIDIAESKKMLDIDLHFNNINFIKFHDLIKKNIASQEYGARLYYNYNHLSRFGNKLIVNELVNSFDQSGKKNSFPKASSIIRNN